MRDGGPWVPDEVEPEGGWPAAPDAVPVVVSAWQQLPAGGARPAAAARRAYAVSRKHDDGRARARRFAEAWRWLQPDGGRARGRRLCDPEAVEWLYAAGVLMPARAPGRRAR
jgi:hypothetical protein